MFWASINKAWGGAISSKIGILFAMIFLPLNAASNIGIPNPSDKDKKHRAEHRSYK